VKIFVLWRSSDPADDDHAPARVGAELERLFATLFTTRPTLNTRSVGAVHLVWLELPTKGFRAPFFEEDVNGPWALASDYPLNARRLLRANAAAFTEERTLLALGRALEARPEPYVRELIPPAALLWSARDEVRVQNDGLGQAQLFEHDDGRVWALTNRVVALRALALALRPVPDEWAARFVTNWFPLDRSGYESVRYLAGGTQLRVGQRRTERTRHDPVGAWLHPEARLRDDALELGRHALLNTLSDAIDLWERPTVGLSGGWDSRAVASCLRVLGADFDLRVRGKETHFDVILSAELARIAGLPHRIKSEGGVPPADVDGCRSSIARALLWQGGYFATKKHKTFLAKEKRGGLDGGVVNVMGQHAGVDKADFVVRTEATKHAPAAREERLLEHLFAEAPSFLRPERRTNARELVRRSYRAAEDHGLSDLEPLLYFYLNEFTRRWGSATVASQSGLVVAPFLCPDMIRACHALPAEELATKPIHRHVTARHAPDWAGVPYADQVTEEDFLAGRLPRVVRTNGHALDGAAEPGELPRWREVRHHRKYHYKFYWTDVGLPLLEEAFAQGGFWSEVFDPDAARTDWVGVGERSGNADALAVAHLLPKVLAGELPERAEPAESAP
jgi:hypothetical protein